MENENERGASLDGSELDGRNVEADDVELTEASIACAARIDGSTRDLGLAVKLLSGERIGWWWSQRYDKRKRMRALVKGAVNDVRTRILLDTEANVSVISASYAKRLRLREVPDHSRSLKVRGINPGVMETSRRALVKITLGWERVYEVEVWIMNHSAGVDVVLGTDFMIPAGVRLDLFHGTARLPDEVMVPQIKSQSAVDEEPYGMQVVGGPTEDLHIPGRERREFKLPRNRPPLNTHEVWLRRTEKLVPTVTRFRRGQPTWIRLTNVSPRVAQCSRHDPVAHWALRGELPRGTGYARIDSGKYEEWQVLAYAESRDETLFGREQRLYERWLVEQPPAVERRDYPHHHAGSRIGGLGVTDLERSDSI